MKSSIVASSLLLLQLLGLAAAVPAKAAVKKEQDTPMSRVVTLLGELKTKIEEDGSAEQASYDKYACWCEDTLARKADDISTGKTTIDKLTTSIQELKGELGAVAEEIDNTKKLILSNLASQDEAKQMRGQEHDEYQGERTETEQCIGALEAAIKVLTGAGSGKKGFLETLQETQLLGVVAGVRSVLGHSRAAHTASGKDLQVVHHFVEHPEEFMGGSSGTLGLSQIGQNPFGDYAPRSTQIQGILKGMYDTFTSDLEKANADESEKEQSFQALMATKQKELNTLQVTLDSSTLSQAEKTEALSQAQVDREDAQKQLKADEELFAETKSGCQIKAGEWNTRTRLRTEELQSIMKAIQILEGGKGVFEAATSTSFLQLSGGHRSKRAVSAGIHRKGALKSLRSLALKFRNPSLAEIAVALKNGGHFDKIVEMIDKMLETLRVEEKADIMHRDRCQGTENKNENSIDDLNHAIIKDQGTLDRLDSTQTTMQGDLSDTKTSINATLDSIEELKRLRTEEISDFRKSVQDDTEAIQLLEQAIVSLSNFYRNNGIALDLTQKKISLHAGLDPEYTVDQDKAPDTIWSGADYSGRKSETGGIIAILSLIKEDLEKEIQTATEEDAEAQKLYETNLGAMTSALASQKHSKVAYEAQLAELGMKIGDTTQEQDASKSDLKAEEELKKAIYQDCAWVGEHFESRREKRQAEMQGLQEAKSYLARGKGDVPFDESLD